MKPEAGQILSHYRLIEMIGKGGMGVVWRAQDTVLGRDVAIKFLPSEVALDEERQRLLLEESRLASSLGDAHIVHIYELGQENGAFFLVMELVDGQPLSRMLRGHPLSTEETVSIGLQIAEALVRAHRQGLLHRDIKPANVLVTPQGDVKLVDFGLATLFQQRETTRATEEMTGQLPNMPATRPNRDGSSVAAGTLAYMSPEQVRGESLDGRSDIFSLGVVLYEMVTGIRPFHAANPVDLLAEVLRGRARPVHEVVPQIPLELDRIIHKTLAPRREDRYQTVQDLAVDLRQLSDDLDSGSSPSYDAVAQALRTREHRRKRYWYVAATVGCVVLAAAIAGGVRWSRSKATTKLDARAVLVLPFTVTGQDQQAELIGRTFAEAVAVALTQAESLQVLPVPLLVMGAVRSHQPIDQARESGAGWLLTGTLVREDAKTSVQVHLIDATKNRVHWGTIEESSEGTLADVARTVGRNTIPHLGTGSKKLYDRPDNLRGSAQMAASRELAETLGALQASNIRGAMEASERLVKAFPQENHAVVLRARALAVVLYHSPSDSLRTRVEDVLRQLDDRDPSNPYAPAWRAWAIRAFDGRARESIDRLEVVSARSDLTPQCLAWVLRLLGTARNEVADYAGALANLEEAKRLDPLAHATAIALANTYVDSNRPTEAIRAAELATALEPRDPETQLALGRALRAAGKIEQALPASERACELSQSQVNCALYAKGLFLLGRRSEAESTAVAAALLEPNLTGAYNLGCFWALVGDRHQALGFLRQALQLGYARIRIATDSDLVSLHGDPEFEAIVTEINRRNTLVQTRPEAKR